MSVAHKLDWQQETLRYDAPHPRLALCSHMLRRMPQRRLLDVGCSTATLKSLLSADYDYFGCDVADHAGDALGDRFHQIDFNETSDLSCFAGRDIDVIHVGGVLEYLRQPDELLHGLRRLVDSQTPLVLSIINFDSAYYADGEKHHPGWIFKPRLDALRTMLLKSGWGVERQLPFVGRGRLRDALLRAVARGVGVDHAIVRQTARQFVFVARAA